MPGAADLRGAISDGRPNRECFDRGSAAMQSPMKEIMQNSTISSFPDPAARLVRKGSNFESILCGLSSPVSEGGSLACICTF
jgi:hypothetical protein